MGSIFCLLTDVLYAFPHFSVPSLLDSDENRKPMGENEHFQQAFDAVWEAHVQQLIPCKSCGKLRSSKSQK